MKNESRIVEKLKKNLRRHKVLLKETIRNSSFSHRNVEYARAVNLSQIIANEEKQLNCH